MAALTLRLVKGTPLTNAELDDNFTNLNIEVGQKLDSSTYTANDILTKLKTVDGTSSGLDADFVRGLASATTNTANTVVVRDISGNFSAGVITANLIGNVTGNVSGTASNVTGVVAIVNGGSGASSASQARTNLDVDQAGTAVAMAIALG